MSRTDTGTVKQFDSVSGTGIIEPDGGGEPIPFAKADFRQPGTSPRERNRLAFELERGADGRRRAVNLRYE